MLLVSNVGLGISAIALLASLPRITQTGGMARFAEDAAAQLWTMALLTAIALPVRTLGWRVFAGTALTGFFGITGLARFVGRPVLESLGSSSIFAVALWIPLTEELVKLIPVAIVLRVATRRFKSRPSALDVMLLGAWTGAGFAVYESAALGRGQFNLFAPPLVSFVFPGEGYGLPFGWPVVQTGHLGHTALIALSLALAVLYGRRTRRLTWIFPPIAFGAVLLEHCSQNAMVANGLNELVAKIAIVLSLGGYLSALLLLAAICFALFLEWKITGPERKPAGWLLQKPVDGLRRAALLAQAQTGGVR
jgi:RsiW-degrading membrane proteinase PrsW (M82 family)